MLKRAGHTEAAVDLARMAGCFPAGVLVRDRERRRHDAAHARPRAFAAEHGLVLVTIADLIRYRRHREKFVRRVSEARIPTQHGDFIAHVFESLLDGTEHLAFVRGRGRRSRRTCSSACTRSASPATCSDRCGATAALQLDRALERSRRRRTRRRRLPARPRGPGHRARAQAARVHVAGRRPRHRRGQPRARLPGRLARVRHRFADPRRSRCHDDAADDEQPREVRRHRGLRARDRRAGPAAVSSRTWRTSRTCAPSSASSAISSTSPTTAPAS